MSQITTAVLQALQTLDLWLKAKVEEEHWNQARAVAFDFVSAAEQMQVVRHSCDKGKPDIDNRYGYANKMLREHASCHGINIDLGQIEALIEAAVLTINRIGGNQ